MQNCVCAFEAGGTIEVIFRFDLSLFAAVSRMFYRSGSVEVPEENELNSSDQADRPITRSSSFDLCKGGNPVLRLRSEKC